MSMLLTNSLNPLDKSISPIITIPLYPLILMSRMYWKISHIRYVIVRYSIYGVTGSS